MNTFKKVVTGISVLSLSALLSINGVEAASVKAYGPNSHLKISQKARYDAQAGYGESATEIVSVDYKLQRAYSINGALNAIDILDLKGLKHDKLPLIKRVFLKDLGIKGSDITSVAVNTKHHYIAVSIPAENKTDKGTIAFLTPDGKLLSKVKVGSLPDMVTFTSDYKTLLSANEGEPNDDFTVNPEGSVSIIKINPYGKVKQSKVKTVRFDKKLIHKDVRNLGRNEIENFNNLEPEYITIDAKNRYAYVSIQERNAIAKLDIAKGKFVKVKGLGYKSYQTSKLDVSDKDGKANMQNYPLFGMYQPDGVAKVEYKGKTYILTANEGDSQDYKGFSEETRVQDIKDQFNPTSRYLKGFNLDLLGDKKSIGRLKTSIFNPFTTNGKYDVPVTFGGRSFSVLDGDSLKRVYDSKDDFESIVLTADKDAFNSDQETRGKIEFDSRSDDKGVEPESVTVGKVNKHTYAFIGLERANGIMVYNIDNPTKPKFETYFKSNDNGDISPEGITFISKKDSPTKQALLLVSHEMSGTIAAYELK